jgi:hypothetical protein
MKKSQFYLLFSIIFSFFFLFLLIKNLPSIDNTNEKEIINNYFVSELSYLNAWNCSYNLTTIKDFIKKTNLNINLYYYWDNCNNKVIKLKDYFDYLIVNETKNYYIVCLKKEGKCFNLIKGTKHFCLVYKIYNTIYFNCW